MINRVDKQFSWYRLLQSITYPLIVLFPFILLIILKPVLPEWLHTSTEAFTLPYVDWINAVVNFLKNTHIFIWFTFKDMTRAIAAILEWPLDMVEGILVSGFGDTGIPSLPWVMSVGLFGILGYWLKGWRLGLLAGGCIFYMALFGKWKLSMITLSTVLVAAPIAGLIGLGLGIAAVKYKSFAYMLWPSLNVMQSLPHFSYLIPVAIFIGVSHKAGVIATILFAIAPMARLTILGLRSVSTEVLEAGIMAGCTPRQMLWKVRIPAASNTLMIGVNQVIMQCLAMVVIASFVGAKGLGQDLLFRLQSLRIGQALEIGVAIVFIAIMLDRLSLALSEKQPVHKEKNSFWRTHPCLTATGILTVFSFLAAWITPVVHTLPKDMTITMAPMWDALVDYTITYFYQPLHVFRDVVLIYCLIPLRNAVTYIPWISVVWLFGAIGWYLGRWRLALKVTAFVLFIVTSGFYARSLVTAYMVFAALLVCVAFGVPLGIWASASERWKKITLFLCDTLQTFPSFVYLIPVIMLFRVGDVAAITAIVVYSTIPVVRYTIVGLCSVPQQIIEAAMTSGCTPMQTLFKVRLPLAFPQIMLGVNQTIMFALFMVIIAAFIGTTDLGQEIFRALTFNDAGKGLVVGLCVAFMGLAVDGLITEWAEQKKKTLGIS